MQVGITASSHSTGQCFRYGDVVSESQDNMVIRVKEAHKRSSDALCYMEKPNTRYRLLARSKETWRDLGGIAGVPYVTDVQDTITRVAGVVVHQPLAQAKTLEHVRIKSGGRLPRCLLHSIAQQCFQLLYAVHLRGYALRNIKPDTFVLHAGTVYLASVDLAKRVVVQGKHIVRRKRASLIAHPSFASQTAHCGWEPVRRDDVEAMVYLLMYMDTGALDWCDAYQASTPYEDIARAAGASLGAYADIAQAKRLKTLCAYMPPCFEDTLSYARGLEFAALPDGDKLACMWAQPSARRQRVKQALAVLMGALLACLALVLAHESHALPSVLVPLGSLVAIALILYM